MTDIAKICADIKTEMNIDSNPSASMIIAAKKHADPHMRGIAAQQAFDHEIYEIDQQFPNSTVGQRIEAAKRAAESPDMNIVDAYIASLTWLVDSDIQPIDWGANWDRISDNNAVLHVNKYQVNFSENDDGEVDHDNCIRLYKYSTERVNFQIRGFQPLIRTSTHNNKVKKRQLFAGAKLTRSQCLAIAEELTRLANTIGGD